jgi:hypothetical protein
MSPQFGHVVSVHRETSQGALLAQHAATLRVPGTPPVPGPPPGPPMPNLAAALTIAFAPLVASRGKTPGSTTQVEREHQQDILAVQARYQLGWARIVEVVDPLDGSIAETVVFPKLSDALAVLSPSKVSKAEASYQESVTNHLRSKARSTSYFDGMSNWDVKSLGIPGISCVREFCYATEPPTHDPDELKDKLTILHFARTDPGSVAYKSRQEDGRLLNRQYMVDEDKSKLKRKVTDLYYSGQIATADDLSGPSAPGPSPILLPTLPAFG